MHSEDQILSIRDNQGRYIGDPSHMFLAATCKSTNREIQELYEELVNLRGVRAVRRLNKLTTKQMTYRRYAGSIVLMLWRNSQLSGKTSLGQIQGIVATFDYAWKNYGSVEPETLDGLNSSDKEEISRRIEEVRKGWRRYRNVAHYLAVLHARPDLFSSIPMTREDVNFAFGLAKSFQAEVEQNWKSNVPNIVKVPNELEAVPLEALSLMIDFWRDNIPTPPVRHHK